jgi:hypothetical protein
MKKIICSILIVFFLSNAIYAQESESEADGGKNHKIAFVFGYTHIPSAFEEGQSEKTVFVPTIGLDYFYQLNEKWSLGFALDLELGNYLVRFNREDLARKNAIVTAVLVEYEIAPRWGILVGPGIEFEKNKNLFIFRAGLEYEFDLGKNWCLFPSINSDFKEEYNTWSLNIGLCKRM